MDITIFVSLLFSLQFFYWVVGRKSGENTRDKEDYFLAGKTVSFFPLMMTFTATVLGGGLFFGAAEEAYQFGWPVLLYPIGSAIGMVVLGSGVGRKLASFQVSTVAQIFEVAYQSTALKRMASMLSVVSLFMILVAQIVASSKFLVSIGFDSTPLFLLFWAIVILYTVQGGLRAVISTDIVQASFFSIVFLMCFGMVVMTNPSVGSLRMPQMDNFMDVSSKLSGWLLLPLLWMVIGQDMGQRCFAGASPQIISKASLWSGVVITIVCFAPVFFGCLAKSMGLQVPEGSSVLMTTIVATTNPWIAALVGCAVLAAIISTATSLINAISSNISNDFQLPILQGSNGMRMVRTMTCSISIAAILVAFSVNNIVDLLLFTYELAISCTFVPIFMALWKKRGNFISAVLAILFGVIGFVLFRFVPIEFPREIVSLALSFTGFAIGELTARVTENVAKNTATEVDI